MRTPLSPTSLLTVRSCRQLLAFAGLLLPLSSQAQFSPPPISGTTPAHNANSVPLGTDISLTYTEAINPMDLNDVRVFSQQAGGRKAGTTSVFGNRITFNPTQDFKPGEVVFVTPLPALGPSSRAKRYVYQFTTRAGVGPATFSGSEVRVDGQPNNVVAADVNNDGHLDFLTANRTISTTGTVSVRLGNGQGAFSGTTSIPVGNTPLDLVAADINGDGDLDFLALSSDNETVNVRLGNGQGGFTAIPDVPVGSSPQRMAVADVNGDGNLDLLVTDFGSTSPSVSGQLRVRLGNGRGGFSGTTNVAVNYGTRYLAVADVNGDGYLDFLTGTSLFGSTSAVSVRLGDGLGNFSGTTDIAMPVGTNLYSLVMADVNNDGNLDFVASNSSNSSTGPNSVTTHLGNGQGGFSLASSLPISGGFPAGSPHDIQLADVNGDGNLDLATANFSVDGTASVRLGNGQGSFSGTLTLPAGFRPTDLTVGDIDGDGDLDLLVASFGTNSVVVLRNQPLLSINSFSPTSGPVGTSVVLTGTGFTGATAVTFHGVAAPGFVVNSATQLTVTVPVGATTGPITVTTPAATGISSTSFQVTPVNSAPVIANQTFTIADNSPSGLLVGTIVASDPDAGQTLTYALLGSNTTGAFTVVDNELRVLNPAELMSSPTSTFSLGVRVTDNGTPSLSATALVTVQLTRVGCTTPVLTPPANQRVVAASGQCSASVDFAAAVTGSPAPTLRYTIGTTPITSPYAFPVGTTNVTVTATNTCGTTTESFAVTVEDRQAPVIRAAGFITAIERNGLRTIEAADVDWGSFDNCSGIALMTISPRTFTCANIGPNQVTLTVTDNAGNSASETVTVILVDNIAPVIVAAGFETTLVNGTRTIEAADIDYGSYDLCGSIASMSISPRTFTCANVGPNQVTVTVTDNSGNVATQTVTMLIQGDATCTNSVANSRSNAAAEIALSNESQLHAYPNPVTDQATVSFHPIQAGKAQAKVYNQLGVLVATLYDGQVEASRLYSVTLNGALLASGVYNCQLIINGKVTNQRLLVSK